MTSSNDRIEEALNEHCGYYFTGTRLSHFKSEYQDVEIWDTPELGKVFRLDNSLMTSERDEFVYHENMVHPALVAHANPRRALVIGGGDGGSSEEILKHPSIEHCVMAELDEAVVRIAKQHFHEVHRGVFDDKRLDVRIMDGYKFIRETDERFDFVLLDLTDPKGPSLALYTREFYGFVKRVLAPGGAMTLHIGAPFAHPQRVRETVLALRDVFKIVRCYGMHIPIYGSYWGMAVCSESLDPTALSPALVAQRIDERKLSHLQYYNAATHHAAFALPNFYRELIA